MSFLTCYSVRKTTYLMVHDRGVQSGARECLVNQGSERANGGGALKVHRFRPHGAQAFSLLTTTQDVLIHDANFALGVERDQQRLFAQRRRRLFHCIF